MGRWDIGKAVGKSTEEKGRERNLTREGGVLCVEGRQFSLPFGA